MAEGRVRKLAKAGGGGVRRADLCTGNGPFHVTASWSILLFVIFTGVFFVYFAIVCSVSPAKGAFVRRSLAARLQ